MIVTSAPTTGLPDAVTTIIGPAPNFEPHYYFYEHVNDEYDITFGQPIHSIADLEFDHSSCNYFATLCGQTSTPTPCKEMGRAPIPYTVAADA